VSWLAVLVTAGSVLYDSWTSYNDHNRRDGTSGHTTIDFGAQWVAARVVLEGNGPQLFHRNTLRNVAQAAFPPGDCSPPRMADNPDYIQSVMLGQVPPQASAMLGSFAAPLAASGPLEAVALLEAGRATWTNDYALDAAAWAACPKKSSGEFLLSVMMGSDPPEVSAAAASFVAPLAASSPLELCCLLAAGQPTWEDRAREATAPQLGGALYPPVHAVLLAPLALLPARLAYRVVQVANVLLVFLCGWFMSRLARGRLWWPIATLGLLAFPGVSAAITLAQNPVVVLTFLLAGWLALCRGRPALAGVAWGFLAFKPTWAIAFLLVPVLARRWRMAAAMALTGAGLVLLTLPIVGVQCWLDWRTVGAEANLEYGRYRNWVFLSRDLQNIPRRYLHTFGTSMVRDLDNPWPGRLGVGLLVAAGLAWVGLCLLRPRRIAETEGHGAAFLTLGAWLTCLHFMYYDAAIAALPVSLLLTEPRRYLDLVFWRRPPPPEALGYYHPWLTRLAVPPMPLLPGGLVSRWLVNPPELLLLILICLPPALAPGLTGNWEFPPFETFALLVLWGWCGWRIVRDR
jgi:hypothetical protein